MACIRALVIIEYQVINRLIFQPKHIVCTQKNHQNHQNETSLINSIIQEHEC